MSDVGQEIRRLREAKDWSQPKLAVEAGVAVSGVSQIENGRRNPNSSTLTKLARALDVDIADLFPKGQPQLPETPSIEEILEQAGTETRWGAISDAEWDRRLESATADEALRLYKEVEAERLATLEYRRRLSREGTPAEKIFVGRMWERYLVRTLRAAQAAGNELVIEEAFKGAQRELVGASA
jgi:transcriptional regulator with XRE-family HTH domain